MTKKWICALLALMMVFSVLLAGCGTSSTGEEDEEGDEKTVSLVDNTKARTVTLLGITDDSTTEEGILRTEALLNTISKSKYKTQIKLILKTADEYEDYINSVYEFQLEAEEAAESASKKLKEEQREQRAKEAAERAASKIKSKWTTAAETEPVETEEEVVTETDENGRIMMKYPDVTENQVDIVFTTGAQMYFDFYYKGYFMDVNEDVEQECNAKKDLSKYIYPLFLNATDLIGDGKTFTGYANNHAGGMSKYLLIDKALADKYGLDASSVKQLMDCEAFLDEVKKSEKNVTPINYVPDMAYVDFFGKKDGLIGTKYYSLYSQAAAMNPGDLYLDEEFKAYLVLKDKLLNGGFTSKGTEDEKYAIRVIDTFAKTFYENYPKGETEAAKALSDKYYIVEYEKSFAKNDNVYAGVYNISSYSKNPGRALEIINLLSTDSEFVNAFAYGLLDTDYEINEDGTVHRLDNGYRMDLMHCGNAYMAYVPEEYVKETIELGIQMPEGFPANYWELCKQQNIDAFPPTDFINSKIGTTNVAPYTFMALASDKEDYQKLFNLYAAVEEKYVGGFKAAANKAEYLDSIRLELASHPDLNKCLAVGKTSFISLYEDYHDITSSRTK